MILVLALTGCSANNNQSSDDADNRLSVQTRFDADDYYARFENCVKQIREKTDSVPDIALVLGSGLGDFADSFKIGGFHSGNPYCNKIFEVV